MYNLSLKNNAAKAIYIFILQLLFLLGSVELLGQKFGDVKAEDFEVELPEKDSAASVVYLLHNEEVEYTVRGDNMFVNYFIHDRIKVLSASGMKYGNFDIGEKNQAKYKERVSGVKGFSYNLVDGKVVETKLDKEQIFREESSEDYIRTKFAMPNVKEGTIIDVTYKLSMPSTRSIERWFFQKEVPVLYSEMIIKVPDYFDMTPIPTGFVPLEREQELFNTNMFSGVKYTFWAKDIPSLKDDDYVLSIDDYRTSLKYEISRVKWSEGREELYSSSWDEIARDHFVNSSFGPALTKKYKSLDLQVINAKKLEGKDQVKYLYDYVRNTYNWTGYKGLYAFNLRKVVDDKEGDIAEINLLLINLLLKAGHDVKPALLKTRSRGILNETYPTLTEFDYVVAEVTIGDEVLLLDATSKKVPMGNLPTRANTINYMAIDETGGEIKYYRNPNTYKVINMINYDVNVEEEVLIGGGKYRYSDYAAILKRESLATDIEKKDGINDVDTDAKENVTITISIDNEDDIYKPITYELEEKLYEQVRVIEDKIFIDACLDSSYDENPFTEEKRDYPIFYSYKLNFVRSHQIKIPKGYVVESLPEAMVVKMGNSDGKFIYDCKEQNDAVVISMTLIVNNDIILPEQYQGVKQFYDLIEQKHKEKIVLTKN